MGVPSFYRWLRNKYPKIVVTGLEDATDFDNLYLDMNGIIHPCFHPDHHTSPPISFEQVFHGIFEYIDMLFNLVKPRNLLYMAIDGVAPRAKMNQQRSRRFQTAKDNELADEEEDKLRKEFDLEGKQVLPKQESEISDSNIITPGTDFMFKLSSALQDYICSRIKNDERWKNIKVILSDANVPGEGEHKIMSFIRSQRNLTGYNPNTRHCIYGLDADLIMLALCTHEPHFSILREDVSAQDQPPRPELTLDKSTNEKPLWSKKPFEFLYVWILREYLELDMQISDPPKNFEMNLERIIDDFIFMCFFAGNDFLPHMPTLEIHEGAMDLLMDVYKKEFKNLGGYLVDMNRVDDKKSGFMKLSRVEKFILLVGSYEEKIFSKRLALRDAKIRRMLSDYSDSNNEEDINAGNFESDMKISNTVIPWDTTPTDDRVILQNTKELKEKLRSRLRKNSDFKDRVPIDKVRLGCKGYKERYYVLKFSSSPENIESMKKEVIQKYTEGLAWVLQYYFSGVPSWTWFYPYHYAPFASDLKGMSQVKIKFEKGVPFKPLDQLMGVLPPKSAHALPQAYRDLITDEQSTIHEFYPTNFEIDTDGKLFLWQGISKLPFIDEKCLLTETKKIENELQKEEILRNASSVDMLFVGSMPSSGSQFFSLNPDHGLEKQNVSISSGIGGFVRVRGDDNKIGNSSLGKFVSHVPEDVLCLLYELPNSGKHFPYLLEGLKFPEKTISEDDIEETVLWHDSRGNRRPVTNKMTQFQNRNATNTAKFTSQRHAESINNGYDARFTSATSDVAHQYAGLGWGYSRGRGRGRGNIGMSNNGSVHPPTSSVSGRYQADHGFKNNCFQPSRNVSTYNTSEYANQQHSDKPGEHLASHGHRKGRHLLPTVSSTWIVRDQRSEGPSRNVSTYNTSKYANQQHSDKHGEHLASHGHRKGHHLVPTVSSTWIVRDQQSEGDVAGGRGDGKCKS